MTAAPTTGHAYGLAQGVCDVLGQTAHPGLSGVEIDRLLSSGGAAARGRSVNKRIGLFDALYKAQQPDSRPFVRFINRAIASERYVTDRPRFEDLRQQLSEVTIFHELTVNDNGRVARSTAKSIPSRIREMIGLVGDGWVLCNAAFGHRDCKNRAEPRLFINDYRSESDQVEHEGFRSLLVGIHWHFRNPRAGSGRINRSEDLNDFLNAMSLVSYVHKRLDTARTESTP